MTRTRLFATAGIVGTLMTGTLALALLALNLGTRPGDDTGMSGLGGAAAALIAGGIVTLAVATLLLRRAEVPDGPGLAVLGCLLGGVGTVALWLAGRTRFADLTNTWVPWAALSSEVTLAIVLGATLFVIPMLGGVLRSRRRTRAPG